MIYTMERRHYFGSGSMESRWEVHEYSHRCQSGDLPEGKLVYSCKAKKEASHIVRPTALSRSRDLLHQRRTDP